jgi:tetratricopeptide (TPR) repeat protein
MSRTLNLVARLLTRGRTLHRLGATQEAFILFHRLSGLHNLPPASARQVQEGLSQIHLKRRQYARARRRLAALLALRPDNARYHYLLARAVAADPRGELTDAVGHCRRAVALAPEHAGYRSTLGLLLVRLGDDEEGLACLREARRLAPDVPRVIRRLAKGLCRLGRPDEARAVLMAARFRNAGDRRFGRLWQDFQFEFTCLDQQAEQNTHRGAAADEDVVLLPFVARAAAEAAPLVREDGPSLLPAPHLPRPLRRPGRRHAQ